MSTRRIAAKERARWLDEQALYVDHAFVRGDDLGWMAKVERLNVWNVTFPPGFLYQLPRLWWLRVNGGSSRDLSFANDCRGLRYLEINQVLGMTDLAVIAGLQSLQLLSLYGLPRVRRLPSLTYLTELRRVELRSMKGLEDLSGLFDAPRLEELLFGKMVCLSARDKELLYQYAPLRAFDWWAEDTPVHVWAPVVKQLGLPPARAMHPEEWFKVGWGRDL